MAEKVKKTVTIAFRCTEEEAKMIETDAFIEGCTESELVRNRVFKRRSRVLPREYLDLLSDLQYEIGKIKNNINQVVHSCNTYKAVNQHDVDRLNRYMDSLVTYFAKIFHRILEVQSNGSDEVT